MTVRDLGLLGDSDLNHLKRAAEMGYVLCTHDVDYLEIAAKSVKHSRIIFGQQHRHNIGDWVRFIEWVHTVYTVDAIQNRVEYI